MVSDEHARLRELEQRSASLAAKNERLADALTAARTRLSELDEQLEALAQPPGSYATFLRADLRDRTVDALVGGRKMCLGAAEGVPLGNLRPGQELRLNEQLIVMGGREYARTGDVVTVKLVIDSNRVLVAVRAEDERVLRLTGPMKDLGIRVGDSVLADLTAGFVVERLERPDVEELLLEEIPDVSYTDIGGLSPQIEQIRDTVELPFEQPDLYREHGLKPPKGVLLYGPPGCGKTLIAKAVATSLAQSAAEREGAAAPRSYFLNVKGPQLLDKYVGETERQIRDIFGRARDRAVQGIPVVIFFDEMEALFRTRGSGVSSDVETTIVPQLLAEIDGVESLDNVIVIGASNREDMIDPAILRPGRLDVKIRIERPTQAGAREIVSKYLTPQLPIHADELRKYGGPVEAAAAMADALVERLFSKTPDTEYVELTYVDGSREILHMGDFASGAMIAAVVDRAKKNAIKNLLATGERGIKTEHVLAGLMQEGRENEDLAGVTSPDEWARVNGRTGGKRVTFIRSLAEARA